MSSWEPNVPGVSSSHHDATVSLSSSVIQASGPVVGLSEGISNKEVSVSFSMPDDLGEFGSITLTAQVTNFPSSLSGSAFAYLVSLHDGQNEYINLARSGSSGDCAQAGFYTCSSGSCVVNPDCSINTPSAYLDRNTWEIRQGAFSSAENLPSVNVFPTCNWSGGTAGSASDPSCAFNTHFFSSLTSKKLRSGPGVTYTAKYVLVADSYASVGSSYTAGLQVQVLKKTSTRASFGGVQGGAMDLNLVFVGDKNIKASRTQVGRRNLNTIVKAVSDYFSHANVGVKIGAIHAFEWSCVSGGIDYSTLDVSRLSNFFVTASSALPSQFVNQAVNVFFVSRITDAESSGSNLTILGIDGAIPGPLMNATAVSGVAVSTFDDLDVLNSNCSATASLCALNEQEPDSFELGATVAHELGHFLGLNHLSEYDGETHDSVNDTPICTATQSFMGTGRITVNSCRVSDTNSLASTGNTCSTVCSSYNSSSGVFCPNALECQFNYMMWWTTKNFSASQGTSDGNLFSENQGKVINYHPIVQ
ncbi:MAG: M43 family zinc metalloprotease [Bdellovibrionia bacterium]